MNNLQREVFGIVESLHNHINYGQAADNNLELMILYAEENNKIKKRKRDRSSSIAHV